MERTIKRTAARALVAGVAASLSLAAIVAASAPGPDWLDVQTWSTAAQGTNGVRLSVSTDGTIPKLPDAFVNDEDNLIVGFAWLDGDTMQALVATIHPVVGRDSSQRKDSWHLHTVSLTGGTANSDACVLSIDSTPTAGINVQGSTLSVNLDRSSMPNIGEGERLDPAGIDVATGFTVHGDAGCGSGLGVVLRT